MVCLKNRCLHNFQNGCVCLYNSFLYIITTYKEGTNNIEIKGKVLISELSGSESLIHFRNSNMNWVSLSNGTHQMNVGQEAKLYMNIDEFMYFDQNNKLVSNV